MNKKIGTESLKKIKQLFEKDYGKKCKKFDAFCSTCIVWLAFEIIKQAIDDIEETD